MAAYLMQGLCRTLWKPIDLIGMIRATICFMTYDYESIKYDDKRFFGEFLHLDGNPASTKNANVNGSTTPAVFQVQPNQLGHPFVVVERMLVTIEDGTIRADEYGGIDVISAGGGIHTEYEKDGSVHDLDGGSIVQSNVGWAAHCYDVSEHTFGSGNSFVTVRWTFRHPLVLRDADHLRVTISADLSSLAGHTFMAQGWTIAS